MFVSKRKYSKLQRQFDRLCRKHSLVCQGQVPWKRENQSLRDKLREAKDFKKLLEAIIEKTGIPNPDKLEGDRGFLSFGGGSIKWSVDFPDEVAQYVDDILGGKVVKQEATKCIIIKKDGEVDAGYTKKKADKGYSYKLVREK